MMQKIVNLVIYIVFCMCGIAIGKLLNIPFFEIKKEIDPVQLLSIGITIFVAFFIAQIINKNNDNNSREKGLVLKRTEDLFLIIDLLEQKIVTGEIDLLKVASTLKRINLNTTLLFKFIKISKILIKIPLEDILKITSELNDLITNTSLDIENEIRDSDLSVEIKDNIINLHKVRVSEIETKIDNLKGKILELQLEINRGA